MSLWAPFLSHPVQPVMNIECEDTLEKQKGAENMLTIPDMLASWPMSRAVNPHYREVDAHSSAWLGPSGSFPTLSQGFRWREALEKTDPGLLAAHVYPRASKEHLRTGCDIMRLFVIIEEATDNKQKRVCHEVRDVVVDVLKNPHRPRPAGEIPVGLITQEFWQLALKTATPSSAKHLVESFTDYLDGVVDQAGHRENKVTLTVERYLRNRRSDVGTRPAFAIGELHLNLPDEVYYHPVVRELESLITDLIIFFNDTVSYNWEQSTGTSDFNLLTVVMNQFGLNLHEAVAWINEAHQAVAKKYLNLMKNIPSFGPEMDKELGDYINFLTHWPRGNYCWSFEGRRYFGDKGPEVQRAKHVPLLPKVPCSSSNVPEFSWLSRFLCTFVILALLQLGLSLSLHDTIFKAL